MSAMAARLWEISGELETLGALIAENGGEVSPEIEARLDALEGAFEEKVERIALLIRERSGDAAKAKDEKDRLAAIEKYHTSTADGLKRYLLDHMRRTGRPKVETPRARVRVQKNSQPSISWQGEVEDLPEAYRRVTITPDLARVKEDMKSGAEPPDGFLIDYGYHVRVF